MFNSFFQLSGKIRAFAYPFDFFYFHFVVQWNGKNSPDVKFFSFSSVQLGLVFWPRLGDAFSSQN